MAAPIESYASQSEVTINRLAMAPPRPTVADWRATHVTQRPRRREREGVTTYNEHRRFGRHLVKLQLTFPSADTLGVPAEKGMMQLEKGFGTEVSDYSRLMAALGRRGHATAIAEPEKLGNPLTALQRRRDIAGELSSYLLNSVGYDNLTLTGYSQGTDTALHAAEHSGSTDPSAIKLVIALLGFGFIQKQGLVELLTHGVPKFGLTEFAPAAIRDPKQALKLTDNFLLHGIDHVATGIGLGLSKDTSRHVLSRLDTSIPVIHILAEHDAFFPLHHPGHAIAPDQRLTLGPGANHLTVLTHPEPTAQVLDSLVMQHTSVAA